jgi:cellobiose phosphorylase
MKRKTEAKADSLWQFTGDDETFVASNPDHLSRMYFPLCNEAGILSAITPTLHGDIKRDQNHFLTLPLSVEDLHNTRSARNFWLYVDGKEPWSAAGSSASAQLGRFKKASPGGAQVEAGALWHRVTRENRALGLRAEILNFAPATKDLVEIMQVRITNLSKRPLTLTPTAAIPIYGRSADNLRDHRHVTSLLHRISLHDHGVFVTPTMSFDERGHKINTTTYAVLGYEEEGQPPVGSFPTVDSYIGEGGSFDAPEAVFHDLEVPELTETELQGREAVGALRFRRRKLAPGRTATYTLLLGIVEDRKSALGWLKTYGSPDRVSRALDENRAYWKRRLDAVQVRTDDADFNRWMRWVTIQPILRKIFGCSFLPDFDYGRGGRGWRDLWQDCLALILLEDNTLAARDLLLSNFGGVRMNGSNATIIGKGAGEFIADRNNISRTWMDHGVWPWITTELYLHQTGDTGVLLAEAPYFWDQDKASVPAAEKGTVLEHLLAQHLTAYFNAGEHGSIRLEDADWNDGLDMAHERGESVAFTAVYAGNLLRMASVLDHLSGTGALANLEIASEFDILLEQSGRSASTSPVDKQKRLSAYRERTAKGVSGKKRIISASELAKDLRTKGESLAEHVRTNEWIEHPSGHAWFNGYYDNEAKRVEGAHPDGTRMTLTGQVFPIMSGVATPDQVERAYLAAKKFLQDRRLGGFRLNTNFGAIQPTLGRAFSFAYGEKENGAFFSHMVVMFANALYQRGFSEQGYEVLTSLYRMARTTDVSKIYPGVPEYFNGEGRGLYLYLTGSASWLVMTLVTQVLGIRGEWGDLLLAPKLMPEQFGKSGQVTGEVLFAGKRLKVTYMNRGKRPHGQYKVESVLFQGRSLQLPSEKADYVRIPRLTLEQLRDQDVVITIALA